MKISFLFSDEWMSWFDLVIVDGQKPRFFSSGTPLLRVDKEVVSLGGNTVRIRQLWNWKTTLNHNLSVIYVTFKANRFNSNFLNSVVTVSEMGRITISVSHVFIGLCHNWSLKVVFLFQSLKYQRFAPSDYKDQVGIRKSEFVANTKFMNFILWKYQVLLITEPGEDSSRFRCWLL